MPSQGLHRIRMAHIAYFANIAWRRRDAIAAAVTPTMGTAPRRFHGIVNIETATDGFDARRRVFQIFVMRPATILAVSAMSAMLAAKRKREMAALIKSGAGIAQEVVAEHGRRRLPSVSS